MDLRAACCSGWGDDRSLKIESILFNTLAVNATGVSDVGLVASLDFKEEKSGFPYVLDSAEMASK